MASPLRGLFPETEPFSTGRLRVDALHEIHYEQYGNPYGKPVLFLHGGPGGGTSRVHSRFWDPARHRVVLFDQRGCGKSTPHACPITLPASFFIPEFIYTVWPNTPLV
jgi:proline iminopeptidase